MELYQGKDQEGDQESNGAMLTDGCQDVDIPVVVILRLLYSI